MTRSALYRGTIRHARRDEHARRAFHYPVYVASIDLDELPALDRELRLFSHGRRNLFSLDDRDYATRTDGPPTGTGGLRAGLAHLLAEHGLPAPATARLVTNLKVLGYVFNPVSFFLGYDAAGALTSVVAEVNNNYGGRHRYVLGPAQRVDPTGQSPAPRAEPVGSPPRDSLALVDPTGQSPAPRAEPVGSPPRDSLALVDPTGQSPAPRAEPVGSPPRDSLALVDPTGQSPAPRAEPVGSPPRDSLALVDPTGQSPAPRAEPVGSPPRDSLALIEPAPGAPATAPVGFRHRRDFFVSPFLHGERTYDFWFDAPLDAARLAIAMHVDTPAGERVLTARLDGERRPLADRALAAAALRYPLMTAQVIGLIHYEALKLRLRGVPYHRPGPDHRPIDRDGSPVTSAHR